MRFVTRTRLTTFDQLHTDVLFLLLLPFLIAWKGFKLLTAVRLLPRRGRG